MFDKNKRWFKHENITDLREIGGAFVCLQYLIGYECSLADQSVDNNFGYFDLIE